jgi:uncharacterized protein YeaO (DUF488 family)
METIRAENVKLKRAYEAPAAEDGVRILVDRLWPRGIAKKEAALSLWMKEIAPSTELRKWFGHDPDRWNEFRKRYASEITRNSLLLDQLRSLALEGSITLIYSAHDENHNNAIVLRDVILDLFERYAFVSLCDGGKLSGRSPLAAIFRLSADLAACMISTGHRLTHHDPAMVDVRHDSSPPTCCWVSSLNPR